MLFSYPKINLRKRKMNSTDFVLTKSRPIAKTGLAFYFGKVQNSVSKKRKKERKKEIKKEWERERNHKEKERKK